MIDELCSTFDPSDLIGPEALSWSAAAPGRFDKLLLPFQSSESQMTQPVFALPMATLLLAERRVDGIGGVGSVISK